MNKRFQRRIAHIVPIVPVLLAGALLTSCSDDSDSGDSGANAEAGAPDAAPTSPEDRSLAYSKCMRENGVTEFPDPVDGALKVGPGSGVDPGSSTFKKAQEACKDVAPQGMGGNGGGEPLDSAKVAEWAKCMRENGVPKLPDPKVNGQSMEIDLAGAGVQGGDAAFQKAMDACKSKSPGGGVMIKGGGGQ